MAVPQSVLQRIATDRRMPGGERHSNRHSLILHGCAAPLQNMYSFSERRQYHAIAVCDDVSALDINMSQPLPVSSSDLEVSLLPSIVHFSVLLALALYNMWSQWCGTTWLSK